LNSKGFIIIIIIVIIIIIITDLSTVLKVFKLAVIKFISPHKNLTGETHGNSRILILGQDSELGRARYEAGAWYVPVADAGSSAPTLYFILFHYKRQGLQGLFVSNATVGKTSPNWDNLTVNGR